VKQCKSANPSGFHAVTPAENLIYFMKKVKKKIIPMTFHFPYSFNDQMHEMIFYPTSLGFHFKTDGMTGHNRRWQPVIFKGCLELHFWSWQAAVACFANVQAQEAEMPDPEMTAPGF